MTKVVFGREIVPFDTEEEWEKFWERESGRPSRHIRAQDSWNTYNTALQEIKNGKKKLIGCGLYFRKWHHLAKASRVNIMVSIVLLTQVPICAIQLRVIV